MANRVRLLHFATATLTAVASLAPTVASAQLGKLKKAAADAAKEKAGVKTDAPAAAASGSSNFVITADRLAAVMASMEAGMARAEKEAAAKAVRTDYNTKRKAYDKCLETQLNTVAGKAPSMAAMQKAASETQKTADMSQRMSDAHQKNRYREYVATSDTMTLMSIRSSLVMYGLESKCGAPVYMPPALVDEAAATMARQTSPSSNSASDMPIAPALRGGMSTQQFGMVRERAALWALQQTNNAPADNNKYGIFTKDEQAVLEAQGATLKKWAPVFKESPGTWATWGDIKSW